MAEWLRHPPVETLVVTGSDPGLAKNLFLHFFLTKMNTVNWFQYHLFLNGEESPNLLLYS